MLSLGFRLFLRHLNEAIVLKVFSSEMDPADKQSLKVPKCEIFDRLDFRDFYKIKSLWEGDFVIKILQGTKIFKIEKIENLTLGHL
jgi:hypothetical protein